VEVNLQTVTELNDPLTSVRDLVNETKFDTIAAPAVVVDDKAYTSFITAHQKMVDANGAVLKGADGKPLVDTAFAYNHPLASFADNDYADGVKALTSTAFVTAILGVDFTTPVFSDRRCGLLAHAPQIPVDTAHPADFAKALTDGFVKNLTATSTGPDSPEAELLANLQGKDPRAGVTAFLTACSARAKSDSAAFVADLMTVQSRQRKRFRELPIFEHRELLPDDDLAPADSAHLDPVDCTLKQ
jgi:hypothetical protein